MDTTTTHTTTPAAAELDTKATISPVARRKPAKAAVSAAAAGELTAGVDKQANAQTAMGASELSMQQSGFNAQFMRLVNPNNPPQWRFKNGYDLTAEYAKVKHLVLADEPSVEDAAYGAYCSYLDRVTELNNTLSALAARRYANAEVMAVAPYAANAIDRVGQLTSIDDETGEGDVMTLHTQDAVRLFLGFDAGVRLDGSKMYPIPGAVRVGAALRTISSVAAKFANPYAEMGLMQIEGLFADLAIEVERMQSTHTAMIELCAKRGTRYKVQRNTAPLDVPLGFRSPYGFACADLVSQFDYLVRVVTTTSVKGLVTKEAARNDLLSIKTKFRAVFNDIMRMAVVLGNEQLSQVSRGDWAMYHLTHVNQQVKSTSSNGIGSNDSTPMSGGELAKQARDAAVRLARMNAVAKCEQLFGMLPSALLLGDSKPKFVNSKVRVSAEERVLIQQLVNQRSGIAVA